MPIQQAIATGRNRPHKHMERARVVLTSAEGERAMSAGKLIEAAASVLAELDRLPAGSCESEHEHLARALLSLLDLRA